MEAIRTRFSSPFSSTNKDKKISTNDGVGVGKKTLIHMYIIFNMEAWELGYNIENVIQLSIEINGLVDSCFCERVTFLCASF